MKIVNSRTTNFIVSVLLCFSIWNICNSTNINIHNNTPFKITEINIKYEVITSANNIQHVINYNNINVESKATFSSQLPLHASGSIKIKTMKIKYFKITQENKQNNKNIELTQITNKEVEKKQPMLTDNQNVTMEHIDDVKIRAGTKSKPNYTLNSSTYYIECCFICCARINPNKPGFYLY